MLLSVRRHQRLHKLVNTLKKAGAMDHTIVCSFYSKRSVQPLQYIAPYAGYCTGRVFHVSRAKMY